MLSARDPAEKYCAPSPVQCAREALNIEARSSARRIVSGDNSGGRNSRPTSGLLPDASFQPGPVLGVRDVGSRNVGVISWATDSPGYLGGDQCRVPLPPRSVPGEDFLRAKEGLALSGRTLPLLPPLLVQVPAVQIVDDHNGKAFDDETPYRLRTQVFVGYDFGFFDTTR